MPTKSQSPQKNPELSPKEKAKQVQAQSRMLWAKYDKDLDNVLNGKNQINTFLQHSFKDAKLESDFKSFTKVNQLIEEEVKSAITTKKMTGKAKAAFEKDPQLNQAQVQNIVNKLYKVQDDKAPPKSAKKPEKSKSPTKGDKKKKDDLKTPGDNAASKDTKGSYADFYKDTKAMAKSKNWNDDQISAALANRPKTEAQIKNVSKYFKNS